VDDEAARLLSVTGVEQFTVIAPAASDPDATRPVATGRIG
jgi:hypothetical protein